MHIRRTDSHKYSNNASFGFVDVVRQSIALPCLCITLFHWRNIDINLAIKQATVQWIVNRQHDALLGSCLVNTVKLIALQHPIEQQPYSRNVPSSSRYSIRLESRQLNWSRRKLTEDLWPFWYQTVPLGRVMAGCVQSTARYTNQFQCNTGINAHHIMNFKFTAQQ